MHKAASAKVMILLSIAANLREPLDELVVVAVVLLALVAPLVLPLVVLLIVLFSLLTASVWLVAGGIDIPFAAVKLE